MAHHFQAVLLALVCLPALPAWAGVTVTSYETVALTNAYAPFSQAQYFEREALTNVSPALAEVAGDWTGTNAGGTTPTWHWVGSSRASMVTAFDADSLTVTGEASFSYAIQTTQDFVDPRTSGGVYTPGGAGDYDCVFEIDVPAQYSVSVQLNRYSVVHLGSVEGTVFDRINTSTVPVLFEQSGVIPAGRYHLSANTSLAMRNLPNGVNQLSAAGSFANYNFTVQVPEPALGVIAVAAGISLFRRRRRS